ncbi:MAG: sugar ABC transporter permease, partial [Pseudomonadota bacterium]
MTSASPPTGTGPLGRREARLAWGLLFPTIAIVSMVVVLPLLAIFWISVKPIGLADLRPPAPVVREALRGSDDTLRIQYRVRNSSQQEVVSGVTLTDVLPDGVTVRSADERCVIGDGSIVCDLSELEGGERDEVEIFISTADQDAAEKAIEG